MSAVAVLAARYLHQRLKPHFPTLPQETPDSPRMHEFIITLPEATFAQLEAAGISRSRHWTLRQTLSRLWLSRQRCRFPEPRG
jgi:hypothetical protein